MTKLEELRSLIRDFEKLQSKHAKVGAQDTEPDGIFQVCLKRALRGESRVPTTPDGWELYSGVVGNKTAARALTNAAQKCVDLILSVTVGDIGPVKAYLEGYYWRCF